MSVNCWNRRGFGLLFEQYNLGIYEDTVVSDFIEKHDEKLFKAQMPVDPISDI